MKKIIDRGYVKKFFKKKISLKENIVDEIKKRIGYTIEIFMRKSIWKKMS